MIRGIGKRSLWIGVAAITLVLAGACGDGEVVTVEVTRVVTEQVEVPVDVVRTVVVTEQVVVTPTPPPAPAPTPVPPAQAKVWRIGMPEDITTTNIWSILGPDSTAYNYYALLNRYPSLYALSDQRFDWIPVLADGFPTEMIEEGDFITSTVKLHDGAQWSDGTPITADDVVFTVQTAIELELPGNWASIVDANVIDHAEAIDPSTVKYYFKDRPGLSRWQFGLSAANIVAKHFWEPLVEEAKQAGAIEEQQQALFAIVPENEPTGGEMVFVKWEEGAFVEVRANDRYFFKDSTITQYANGAYEEKGPSYSAGPYYGDAAGTSSVVILSKAVLCPGVRRTTSAGASTERRRYPLAHHRSAGCQP